MSDSIDEQGAPTDEDGQPTGKGLRAQLEKALAERNEFQAKYEEAARKARQSELRTYLAAHDLNPKIAQFIPPDVEGDDGLNKWLQENGELFGVQAPKPQAEPQQVDPAVVAAAQKLQGLAQASSAPAGYGDISQRLKGAKTKEEVAALVDEARRYSLR